MDLLLLTCFHLLGRVALHGPCRSLSLLVNVIFSANLDKNNCRAQIHPPKNLSRPSRAYFVKTELPASGCLLPGTIRMPRCRELPSNSTWARKFHGSNWLSTCCMRITQHVNELECRTIKLRYLLAEPQPAACPERWTARSSVRSELNMTKDCFINNIVT